MAAVNAAPIRNLSCISAIGENSIRPERQAINCLRDKRQKGLSRGRMRVLRARNGRFWTSSRQSSGSSWRWRIRMERAGTSKTESDNCIQETHVEDPRPPFNLDLAVLLAGFAFESYNAPRKDEGVREMDSQYCETTYLAKEYVQALYEGQLCVKVKTGSHFPGLDLWGTSDPYVVLKLGDCRAQSKTIWATKDPVWNEELKLNVKDPTNQTLKIAAWDANVVTAHRRLGNSAVSLESVCDGRIHNLTIDLEGMGGGGTLNLEVLYKSFAEMAAEKDKFNLARLFRVDVLENAFKSVVGDNQISVGDFLKILSNPIQERDSETELSKEGDPVTELSNEISDTRITSSEREKSAEVQGSKDRGFEWNIFNTGVQEEDPGRTQERRSSTEMEKYDKDDEVAYWKTMADTVSEKLKPLGVDISGVFTDWDSSKFAEDVKSFGLASQRKAEEEYVKQGLLSTEGSEFSENAEENQIEERSRAFGLDSIMRLNLSPPQSVENLRKQTDKLLGVWALFTKSSRPLSDEANDRKGLPNAANGGSSQRKDEEENSDAGDSSLCLQPNEQSSMFSTAESAMEAWALLATTMGGVSLLKSDFKKICFVENAKTDTQVAIWRDQRRKRLVVAFRGTEQTKWKDVLTDLSLIATGFNPERVEGGSKDEILVHGGFLSAYDSVKARLLSLVHSSIEISEDGSESDDSEGAWHIYVTGHSLGGALATLFALDLASCHLAKEGRILVTMYNYGSPRVGNSPFAEKYNKTVKDSWRVVNNRDIVPTVPRLMGYCHVAQPIYLTAHDANVMSDLLDDGYRGDVIGEATPDVILGEIMKGEQRVLQKLLDTEITMLRAMRDGSAVMQHMEDFYYITLLQRVEARISHSRKQ
ncbi:hypothetical protein MPTK1_8g05610 [Marchantia polymorpha subsp. ruderalis]|uniref:C2 domain-containing protein n=1 Tax=Marchantia polymorpha TaxID=3197 RepID=A0A2R6WKG0_MARPO|nr:hypothetical protein MARPO_0081s0062 [Marchantia polymorpha]BBN18801.1 hypothetical protein Mp_8g05610 [Marchantia polymorpha subsp. ruderalis]|eukprot:PTQ34339.1 hypothetical protein MARPO_0081s0062 [Marchantia polymorpha]